MPSLKPAEPAKTLDEDDGPDAPEPRNLTYAVPEDDDPDPGVKRRRISYGLTQPGRSTRVSQEDNPMSANFVPLSHRGAMGKARWWALFGRRAIHPMHGEFDEKKVL